MSEFLIFETQEFQKRLKKMGPSSRKFIQKKLVGMVYPQLRINPVFGIHIKQLRNYDPKTWRYRIGKFRIFYSINFEDRIVNILTIDHRKDAYRK